MLVEVLGGVTYAVKVTTFVIAVVKVTVMIGAARAPAAKAATNIAWDLIVSSGIGVW